jgi:hypothetical protein
LFNRQRVPSVETLEAAVLTQFRLRSETVEVGTAVLGAMDEGASLSYILASFIHHSWNMVLMEVSSKHPRGLGAMGNMQFRLDMKVRAAKAALPILFPGLTNTTQNEIMADTERDLNDLMGS